MAARFDGANTRLRADQDARAWLAWHTAALSRMDRLPEFETLLSARVSVDQTPGEQSIAFDAVFLAWGGDPADLKLARAGELQK